MLKRHLYLVLLALFGATLNQSNCHGQAFFPLERQVSPNGPEGLQAQGTIIKLNTFASDPDDSVDGEDIDSGWELDREFMTDPESSAASTGTSVATSDGVPTAQTLPAETYSATTAESIASIGGIWSLTTGNNPSSAWANNMQQAIAQGYFTIRANPTYPTITDGTAYIEFDILNTSDYHNVFIDVQCGSSFIQIQQNQSGYTLTGYLEGYGSIYDSDTGPFPGGLYTSSHSATVGDTIWTYANVYGDLGASGQSLTDPNSADGGTASISATTSVYVSNP